MIHSSWFIVCGLLFMVHCLLIHFFCSWFSRKNIFNFKCSISHFQFSTFNFQLSTFNFQISTSAH